MLNKEKYAKEIVELAVNNETIALKDNKPISCRKIHCNDCEQNVPGYGCSMKKLTEWANSKYKEPILDEVEKEYLGSVIKPFRDRVISVRKYHYDKYYEYITIIYYDVSKYLSIYFPPFKKGTMYKGMELNKEYTLEELGL